MIQVYELSSQLLKLFFSDSQIDTWTQMDRLHSLYNSTDKDQESRNVTLVLRSVMKHDLNSSLRTCPYL